jgi:hypothetical protein
MIKARLTTGDGRPLFLLGLSDLNVHRLREKDPILVDLEPLGGPPVSVAILWGATEQAMVDDLRAQGFDGVPAQVPSPPEEVQFPRGKVRPDDEGALMASIRIKDATIFIDFPKPVSWLALGLREVDVLIKELQKKREQLAEKEA